MKNILQNPQLHKSNPFGTYFICYIPKNWNVDRMLKIKPPDVSYFKDEPHKIRDRVVYIATAINRAKLSLGIDDPNDEKYIPLNAQILQSVVRDYKKYLDYLVSVGILECDNWYSGDYKKSYGYRFTKNGRKKPKKEYIIFDKQFCKQITKHQREQSTIDEFPELYNWLKKLKIDEFCAKAELNQYVSEGKVTEPEQQFRLINSITNPDLWIYTKGKTGRLFTHVSFLQSELRKHLYVEGSPHKLVKLDVSNCIPFLSIALLDKELFNKLGLMEKLNRINPKLRGIFDSLLILVEITSEGKIYEDVELYKSDVTSGKLYDNIKWIMEIADNTTYTRKFVKQKILNVFSRPPDMDDKWSDVFDHYFPNVLEAFRAYSTGYYKIKNGKGKRKWKKGDQVSPFAYAMQELESDIILKTIVPQIIAYNKDIPIYTIHDCIMTTENYQDVVKNIMESTFYELFGVIPEIKVE